jgi:hypothetical protein
MQSAFKFPSSAAPNEHLISSNKILISGKNVEVAMVKFKLLFWHMPGEIEEIPKKPQSYQ